MVFALCVKFEDDGAAIAVLHGEEDAVAHATVVEVEGGVVALDVADVSGDPAGATTRPQLDLAMMVEAVRGDLVRCELERSNIPSQHLRRQFGLDMAQEKRDADPSESNTAVERVPSGRL